MITKAIGVALGLQRPHLFMNPPFYCMHNLGKIDFNINLVDVEFGSLMKGVVLVIS